MNNSCSHNTIIYLGLLCITNTCLTQGRDRGRLGQGATTGKHLFFCVNVVTSENYIHMYTYTPFRAYIQCTLLNSVLEYYVLSTVIEMHVMWSHWAEGC